MRRHQRTDNTHTASSAGQGQDTEAPITYVSLDSWRGRSLHPHPPVGKQLIKLNRDAKERAFPTRLCKLGTAERGHPRESPGRGLSCGKEGCSERMSAKGSEGLIRSNGGPRGGTSCGPEGVDFARRRGWCQNARRGGDRYGHRPLCSEKEKSWRRPTFPRATPQYHRRWRA